MFNILKIILDDFREEKNYLFFAPTADSKPDVIGYLQKIKRPDVIGIIIRFSERNNVNLANLLNTYGIRPEEWQKLLLNKPFRLEDLDSKSILIK